MNKVGKTMMYMGGMMGASMMGYYLGMPKNKKEEVKSKMKNFVSKNDSMNDLMK